MNENVRTVFENVKAVFEEALKSVRATKEERDEIMKKPVAQFIVAMSFICGCEQPERCAIANSLIYFTSIKGKLKKYSSISENDKKWGDRFKIFNMIGGDSKLKKRAIALLMLCDLQAKKKDLESDIKKGIYNPINGNISYDSEFKKLVAEIQEVNSPEMEEILPLSKVMDSNSDTWFWS